MKKIFSAILAFTVFSSFFFTNQMIVPVQANSSSSIYENEPDNLTSLTNNLKNSLVGVTCQDTGLGVPVAVNFSEEDKNRGRNSYILTSYQLMKECFSYGGPKPKVTYKGKVYDAEAWTYALDVNLDLAAVVTSVNLVAPTWSTYIPEKNWFVVSAQWFKGSAVQNYQDAGPVFGYSRVSDVNPTGYKFSVKPLPRPLSEMKSGISFDRNGDILGNLAWMPPWEEGVARVSGVPLWCNKKNGSSTEASVLNCSIPREDRWKATAPRIGVVASPSPSPSPSPSVSARDASAEGMDAYTAAIDAYNLFNEARQTCQSAFRGTTITEKKILSVVSGTKICGSKDSSIDIYYKRLLDLRSVAFSPSVTSSTLSQINSITTVIENLTEDLDYGTVMGEDLRNIGDAFVRVQTFLEQFRANSDRTNKVLSSLPVSLRNAVKKSQTYLDYSDLISLVEDFDASFDSFLQDLTLLASPKDPYFEIVDGIGEIDNSVEEIGDSALVFKNLMSSIPSFYCKKSTLSEFPKNGKCKTGFTKVTIKKS